MNITIFGATGMVGRRLITHALAAGHHVKAFGRNVESLIDRDIKDKYFEAVKGYIFDSKDVRLAVNGCDAILSALGGDVHQEDKTRSLGMKNIVAQMDAAGVKRIVAVGGTGVLPMPDGSYYVDDESYDEQYLAVGKEHLAAYNILRDADVDYTMVCPPQILDADANNTFKVVAEQLPHGWEINAGDLALFMVRELQQNKYLQQRVTLYNN